MLQTGNLHSGQRSGDLHRQGDGPEKTTQRDQWKREVRIHFQLDSIPCQRLLAPSHLPHPHLAVPSPDGDDGGDDDGVNITSHWSLLFCLCIVCFYYDQKFKNTQVCKKFLPYCSLYDLSILINKKKYLQTAITSWVFLLLLFTYSTAVFVNVYAQLLHNSLSWNTCCLLSKSNLFSFDMISWD